MKHFERIILAVGFVTLALLVWKFDPGTVWGLVCRVGWGFLIILPMQLCDHLLNAVGWRYAFAKADAARVPFWQLVRVRVAGDGVNYLTPSATIAGEVIRPGMLAEYLPAEARNSSVVVAKFAQSLGQAFFALVGLLVLVPLRLGFLSGRQVWAGLAASASIIMVVGAAMAGFCARRSDGTYFWRLREPLAGLRDQTARYLRDSPGRFALSSLFFLLGFAWGAWEVLVICYFLGHPHGSGHRPLRRGPVGPGGLDLHHGPGQDRDAGGWQDGHLRGIGPIRQQGAGIRPGAPRARAGLGRRRVPALRLGPAPAPR